MNQPPATPPDHPRQPGAVSTRGRLVIRRHEPEPKALTLLWSLYLLVAAGMTIFAADHLWIYDANVFRISSKIMVAMIGVGIGALWPMVRLSQASPEKVAESSLADALALWVPAQAVLWPLTLLGGWAWGVTGALAMAMIAWMGVFGGIIALGVSARPGIGRSLWMLIALAIVAGAPIWAVSTGWTVHEHELIDWRLCSPLTTGWGLTSTLSGGAAAMTTDKWAAVEIPAALALVIWAMLAIASGVRRTLGKAPDPRTTA